MEKYERLSRGFGLRILTAGGTASRPQRIAGVRTDSLGPPKLVMVKGKVATCWLVDMRQSKHGQTAPTTSTEASVDQGCEELPLQPDRHASQTPTEHSALAVGPALGVTHRLSRFTTLELNAAPLKATRIEGGVDDLPHRSGNGAQRIFDVGVIQALTAGAIPQ